MLCTAAIFPLGVEENEPARHTHFRQQRKWRRSLSATPEPHRARQQQLLLKERRQQSPLILFPSFSSEPSFTRNRLSLPFDILTDLPIELSLSILSYLPPQDLISVCLVCHKWYNLAQDRALRKRRLVYIRNQRFNFQLSKENYGSVNAAVPVHVHVTPSVAVTSRPVLSPVNYSDTHYTHSEPQYFHFQQPTSPSWPHLRTPSSAFSSVVDGVEKLSLKPEGSDIRRCLFPDENEKSVCEGGVARPLPRRSNRRSDLQGSGRSSVDLVLCKRTNKSRLRRL